MFQILVTVGPYLYRNTQLLQKVHWPLNFWLYKRLKIEADTCLPLWQICRLLRVYYLSALDLVRSSDGSSNQEGSADEIKHLKEARFRVEEALGTCLLPSLQLIPANPAVGHEIWEVMSLLPYEVNLLLFLIQIVFFCRTWWFIQLLNFVFRLVIAYMVSGKRTMSGILCCWQQGKWLRYCAV